MRTSLGRFVRRIAFKRKLPGPIPKPLGAIGTVAWLDPPPPGAKGVRQEGIRKCLRADLVITDNLHKLSCAQTLSGNTALLIDLLFMITACKPLITALAWALAEGRPAQVPANSITRHLPKPAVCEYSQAFAAAHPNVAAALQKCERLQAPFRPKMKTAAGVNTLTELAEHLLKLRCVDNMKGPPHLVGRGPDCLVIRSVRRGASPENNSAQRAICIGSHDIVRSQEAQAPRYTPARCQSQGPWCGRKGSSTPLKKINKSALQNFWHVL